MEIGEHRQSLRPPAEADSKDELSGLLKSEPARGYIKKYLDAMGAEEICAMFLVEIDRFDEMEKEFGAPSADRIIRCAGQILSQLFRATDIVGRISRKRFLVFIFGNITEKLVYEKARMLCKELQFVLRGEPAISVTASVGAYVFSGGRNHYERMLKQTEQALEKAEKNGNAFYVENGIFGRNGKERRQIPGLTNAVQLQTILKYMDGGVCLLEVADTIRVIYASPGFYQMLGLPDQAFSLPRPLSEIGLHPDYEAEYEQMLRAGKAEGHSHVQRISGNGRDWIWRQVRDVELKLPDSPAPIVLEVSTNISELIEKERQLQESNERLSVAFEQMPHILWEVDVEKKTFNIYNVITQTCRRETMLENFPDSLLAGGLIHPNSVENFREFARALLNGSKAGSSNFIMRDREYGTYEWVYLSYHMIFDRDGNPVKAIGVKERMPELSDIHYAMFPRRPLPETIRHHVLARIEVNLSLDFVESFWANGTDQTAWTIGRSYSELLDSEEGSMFFRAEDISDRFQREKLLETFEKGERWSSREHRRVDRGGNICWMMDTVNLVRDPKTMDVYMFACFCDVQQRHEWERLLPGGIIRNQETGLYDEKTMEQLTEVLMHRHRSGACAMVMIHMTQIGDLPDGDNSFGKRYQDFLAVSMSFALGTDCIVARYKEDRILAFFPNAGSKYDIKKRIEDAFAYVRVSMMDLIGRNAYRFVAGVDYGMAEELDYGRMILRMSYLCEMWENSAMDAVIFSNEEEDWSWLNLQQEETAAAVKPEEQSRRLTRDEQKLILDCVTEMLTAPTLERSVVMALRCLGKYYRADRAYVLMMTGSGQEVTMIHEWIGHSKYSIRDVVSGMKIDRIPLLKRCMKEQSPVVTQRTGNIAGFFQNDEQWSFMISPMSIRGSGDGFLCIENARRHQTDILMMSTLIPYLQKEHERFGVRINREETEKEEMLNRIPNLRSYMQIVYSLDSDRYSSMGAMTIDIPSYSEINSSYGFLYGREMLGYIAKVLFGVFGHSFIFRTWDAEFVILFPNTIQEVFIGRCTRVRTMLQRRYPRLIRMGQTWADGVFTAKDLVREARSIMNCENVQQSVSNRMLFLEEEEEFLQQEVEASKNSYIVYFQPKVDMRTHSLVGAEALVRGIDEKGNVVPPSRFIETLEKNGKIRDLDFGVMESVLRQLSEWKKRGLPPVNVSINISRRTLFNPTALASILAIQSNYPEISLEQIELEITETAWDIEKATLADIVENFGKHGVRFELDDFGSKYANVSIFSNIKFKTIKLDRSLVNDLAVNEISRMMVENIANICKNFGMLCVAEGVETQKQEDVLLKAGCFYGQGYYYARPMPPRKFEEQYLKVE